MMSLHHWTGFVSSSLSPIGYPILPGVQIYAMCGHLVTGWCLWCGAGICDHCPCRCRKEANDGTQKG